MIGIGNRGEELLRLFPAMGFVAATLGPVIDTIPFCVESHVRLARRLELLLEISYAD